MPARAYAHAGDSEKSLGQCREFFRLWKDADPDLLVLNQDNAEYKNLPNNCVASTYLLCPGFEDSDSRRSLKCHSSHKWRNPTGVAASRYQLTLYRPYRPHWVLLGALKGWYIVPLCKDHNGQTGKSLDIMDSTALVSANVSQTVARNNSLWSDVVLRQRSCARRNCRASPVWRF